MKTLTEKQRLNHLLWLQMSFDVHRYLVSNSEGRLDGFEKGTRHENLVNIYVASRMGCELDKSFRHLEYAEAVHMKTRALTDYMDEVIGFPIIGIPNYDELAPKFFKKFVELCDQVMIEEPITRSTISNGIIETSDDTTPWYSQRGDDCGNVYVKFTGFRDGFGVSHKLHQMLRDLPPKTKFKLILEVKNDI